MEGRELVVDTSIFIEYLRAKDKTLTNLYKLPNDIIICISSVTLYELLMGATTTEKENDIRILTEDLLILPFDESASKIAGTIFHKLKKRNKMIEFWDIFIASICLANDFPLLTLNKLHFLRIDQLKLIP